MKKLLSILLLFTCLSSFGQTFSTAQLSNVPAVKKSFNGIVIPQFNSALKVDALGKALSTPALAIYGGAGGGLISGTSGTASRGYLKLPIEITPNRTTVTAWTLTWDGTDGTAIDTLSIGNLNSGYTVIIKNSSGNLVVTLHDGTTFTGSNTNITSICAGFTTSNGYVTSFVCVLGIPTLTGSTNPFLVPTWTVGTCTLNQLFYAGFSNTSVTSRITGFLYNPNGLDGDPTGQLQTEVVCMDAAGIPGEHDNIIILPPRPNPSAALKVVHFFHGRTGTYSQILTLTLNDAGATARTLLNAGYAYIATSNGVGNTTGETDAWGNQWAMEKEGQMFDALQANVKNIGNEYLIGESMGGVTALNYLRAYPDRVKFVELSCPVTDLEENVNSFSIQYSGGSLQLSLNLAMCQWFYSLVSSNTTDPQTDNGTNWRLCSVPGGQPPPGMRAYSYTKVSAGSTSNAQSLTSGASIFPGDLVYFKGVGIEAAVRQMGSGSPNAVTILGSITTTTNELVSVRKPGQPLSGWDFQWFNRPSLQWTASTQSQYVYAKRNTANPQLDVRPINPSKFCDVYASLNVPIYIICGGTSFTGNDGIVNNTPMQTFQTNVNALNSGLVSLIQGSGSHVSATTFDAAGTLTRFNAH